jgi:hypothetical protein
MSARRDSDGVVIGEEDNGSASVDTNDDEINQPDEFPPEQYVDEMRVGQY